MSMTPPIRRPVSVLIVDDSGFMRLALRKMLQRDPAIRIVGEAGNGEEALRLTRLYKPDVITMDVEMPGAGGLEATRIIMEQCPTSIIMVSSLTRAAADTTLKALAAGAVDFIPKASSFVSLDIVAIEKDLCRKIHYWAANSAIQRGAQAVRPQTVNATALRPGSPPDLIVIGASTGGPKVLPQLFRLLPPLACPVVIALHMPPLYTQSFAEHLAENTGHKAFEGQDGMALKPRQVIVAPGGTDSEIRAEGSGYRLRVARDDSRSIHPSVDVLFSSAAKAARQPVGVILTGMGDDGLAGSRELHARQRPLLAQSAESCLVYGMPRAVAEAGLASELLDIAGIARRLSAWAA